MVSGTRNYPTASPVRALPFNPFPLLVVSHSELCKVEIADLLSDVENHERQRDCASIVSSVLDGQLRLVSAFVYIC